MNTRRSLAILATIGALGFAGCGDDDEETPSSTTEETGASGATGDSGASAVLPADFIAEADAICSDGDDAIDAEAEQTFQANQEPSPEDQARFVDDVVLPNIQDQLDDLAAIDPPEEGAEEFDALIENANAALDQIESDPEAFIDGEDPFVEVNEQAQALGLEECGGD